MEFKKDHFHDWTIIELRGRVDSANTNAICKGLEQVIDQYTVKVALDLTPVEFLNLPTIRFLNELAIRFKKHNGLLAVFGATDRTRRHIEIFGDLNFIHLVRLKEELMTALLLHERIKIADQIEEDTVDDRAVTSFIKATAL